MTHTRTLNKLLLSPTALRLRFYVGPSIAKTVEDYVKTLDYSNEFEVVPSTAHLTVMVDDALHRDKEEVAAEFLATMKAQLGTTFGILASDVR